jgi:hypothetical protein
MTVSAGSDFSDRDISEIAGCIRITESAIELITPINFILNRDIWGLLKIFDYQPGMHALKQVYPGS